MVQQCNTGYGPAKSIKRYSRMSRWKAETKEGKSPVSEIAKERAGIRSTTRHEESSGKAGGPPPKAKYYLATDRGEYREGKVKRTPGGE